MTESNQDAYERGEQASEVKEHGRRLDKINGSIEHAAGEMHGVRGELHDVRQEVQEVKSQLQRLADGLAARDTTDAAVKASDKVRREQVETSWSRISGVVTVVISLIAIAAVVGLIVMVATQ